MGGKYSSNQFGGEPPKTQSFCKGGVPSYRRGGIPSSSNIPAGRHTMPDKFTIKNPDMPIGKMVRPGMLKSYKCGGVPK